MTADDATPSPPPRSGPPPSYRPGALEEAARLAREEAAAEGAYPTTPNPDRFISSQATSDDADEPSTDPAVASALAAAEAAKAQRDASGDGVLAFFRELPVLLAVAFLLAFLLRTFVVQVFYIPSGSMIPTLEINDRIVVEKLTYLFRDPVRGEVVVFAGDEMPIAGDDSVTARFTRGIGQFLGVVPANARDFVKRVIGLPGDEIIIDAEGSVFVNGQELDEPYKVDDPRAFPPFLVPEGMLFFLGDNRPASADSRFPSGLGFVSMDHVVGRAMVIVWPFDHAGGLGTPDYGDIPPPQ